jgi:hypothetical protein
VTSAAPITFVSSTARQSSALVSDKSRSGDIAAE